MHEQYESSLATSNLLDYDDLLLRCVQLLRERPSCVSNVEAVLIDEFQDTNLVQFDLMRLFSANKRRVTVVGDPDQSIYAFRSAEIKNLKRMQNLYPDTLMVCLDKNYRSSGAILLAASELIQQDRSRHDKPISPTHCVGTRPALRLLPSSKAEALWIVSEIKRSIAMTANLVSLNDVVILIRSAFLSREIESALTRFGMPYQVVGGQRFFDRAEVKIVLDYLRVISQPSSNDSLSRAIAVPPRKVGDKTLKSLLEEAEAKGVSLWGLIFDISRDRVVPRTKLTKPAKNGIKTFVDVILKARLELESPSASGISLVDLIKNIIEGISFQDYLQKAHPDDHESRWNNVQELIAQASQSAHEVSSLEDDNLPTIEGVDQEESVPADALAKFLAVIALSSERLLPGDEKPTQQVTISTIHAAKGLEWPIVFIPAVYDGSIPHSRAEDNDEERRLLYVAMTRAKALLYMSCPTENSRQDETSLSTFLSHPGLNPYLRDQAPCFKYTDVQSIARILGRPCPPEPRLGEVQGQLQSLNDDLWPLDGSYKKVDLGAFDISTYPAAKKRKTDAANSQEQGRGINLDAGTTLSNPQHFSVSSTTLQSGFVSAGARLRELSDRNIHSKGLECTRSRLEKSRGLNDGLPGIERASEPTQPYPPAVRPSFRKPSTNIREILSLIPKQHDPLQSKPERLLSAAPNPMVSRNKSMPKESVKTDRPPVIPSSLANHRVVSAPHVSRPQKRTLRDEEEPQHGYSFLSSPPSNESNAHDQVFPKQKEKTTPSPTGKGSRSSCHGVVKDSKPASTFHTTSIAAAAKIAQPARTLGVRRSMKGWESGSKSASGFKPPLSRARQ